MSSIYICKIDMAQCLLLQYIQNCAIMICCNFPSETSLHLLFDVSVYMYTFDLLHV
jgi:hypothetical protein